LIALLYSRQDASHVVHAIRVTSEGPSSKKLAPRSPKSV
jgi:hypothetical protein